MRSPFLFIPLFMFTAFFLYGTPRETYAAKKFVPKSTAKKVTTISSVPAVVKFRSDRLGLLLSFSHFNGIESVNYSFIYDTNGTVQGAGGTISANNNPTAQRELLFGTCSSGTCRYHNNISNAKLTLTTKFSSGKKITKIYRIKK